MIFQYSIWVNIPCDTTPPHGWSYKQIKRVTIVTCRPRWLRLHKRPPRPAYYRCGHPADGRRLLHFEVRQLWSVSCWSPARRHAVGRFPSTRILKWLFSRLRLAKKDTVLFFVDFIIIVIYLFILWGLKSEYRRRVWDEDAPNEVAHWGWKASPSFGTFKDGRLCFMSAGLYLPNPFWIIIFIYYYFLSFILLLLFFISFFLNKVTHVHGHPLRPLSNEISPFRISCWSS